MLRKDRETLLGAGILKRGGDAVGFACAPRFTCAFRHRGRPRCRVDQRRQGGAYCQARGYQLAENYVGPGATNDRRATFQQTIDAGKVKPSAFDVLAGQSSNPPDCAKRVDHAFNNQSIIIID
jgi:hypothetical protein